eukprot:Em0244g2a
MGPSPILTKAEEDSLATFCIKLLKFTGGRATVTELNIRKWFTDIEAYIVQEEGAGDILINPQRVFNFDESQFLLAKKKGTVLGPVNYKSFLQVSKENDKEGLTVLMGYSADGSLAPPRIVYAYKQSIPYNIIEAEGAVDPSWALGKPVLVFADGHKSHLSPETTDFCASNGIFLVALYPNSTHMLQPLDISVFRSLNGLWEKVKHRWKTSTSNQVTTKKRFPKVFKLAVDQITDEAVKRMVLGVIFSPFDPNAVDYSKCVKDQLPSKKSSDHASAIHTNYQPSLHYLRSKRWKQLIGDMYICDAKNDRIQIEG